MVGLAMLTLMAAACSGASDEPGATAGPPPTTIAPGDCEPTPERPVPVGQPCVLGDWVATVTGVEVTPYTRGIPDGMEPGMWDLLTAEAPEPVTVLFEERWELSAASAQAIDDTVMIAAYGPFGRQGGLLTITQFAPDGPCSRSGEEIAARASSVEPGATIEFTLCILTEGSVAHGELMRIMFAGADEVYQALVE